MTPADEGDLANQWDAAVEWSAARYSINDLLPPPPKSHLYSLPRALRLWRILRSRLARRALGSVFPAFRGEEWQLPRWLGDRTALRDARLVLKQNQVPAWAAWNLRHRPNATVIHVVRHPGGFLRAWQQRYLARRDASEMVEAGRARLRRIAKIEPEWAERFGNLDVMTVEETELWFWRYTCETIHGSGANNSRYLLVKDEDLVDDPTDSARRMFDMCELPWNERVEAWIAEQGESWRGEIRPWQHLHNSRLVSMVERVLQDSPLRDWWAPSQGVSSCTYKAFDLDRF